MTQMNEKAVSLPSKRQVNEVVKENPRLVDQNQVKSIVQQSLSQLSSIEHRLDRLENQGVIGRVIGSITGSTNKEMISLMRDLTQAQQTTIKLVLTLAVYHAQNVAVMDEILDELDKAKSVHTRTASHIEFLYDQVQMIRDTHRPQKKQLAGRWAMFAAGLLVSVIVATYLFWN
ncbi:hypothetical protein [Paenibacillus naphthalenovorans]|uniref:Uncharacterized protein n=1 Tax=Paenibacillus naphthalenovorans TaxID=162209 RepID=A0A0U2WE07_9BACL|nr:hypothetical protein [Paenibacillus naphthalenovorans]ALS24622.1 hypothetical protein IJ22_43360 [Paenibacillus naphthalenovorans]